MQALTVGRESTCWYALAWFVDTDKVNRLSSRLFDDRYISIDAQIRTAIKRYRYRMNKFSSPYLGKYHHKKDVLKHTVLDTQSVHG